MIWSKQKQILKNNLCESLRDRIDFNIIKYRKSHDSLGRAVITLDKKEICSMATIVFEREHFNVVGFRLDNESFDDYIKGVKVMYYSHSFYFNAIIVHIIY